MKIVFDTNVLIVSIVAHGFCFEVFEHCLRNHEIITSDYIINELEDKVLNKFNYTQNEVNEIKLLTFERIKIIGKVENILVKEIKDKDDYMIIGTAISGKCNCIITGDKELINLKKYKNIDFIFQKDFWQYEMEVFKKNNC